MNINRDSFDRFRSNKLPKSRILRGTYRAFSADKVDLSILEKRQERKKREKLLNTALIQIAQKQQLTICCKGSYFSAIKTKTPEDVHIKMSCMTSSVHDTTGPCWHLKRMDIQV